ncbi:MAG: response regulator [Bdellovibrio sp.]|nr:response regulator [Bdellovibrio sp.]
MKTTTESANDIQQAVAEASKIVTDMTGIQLGEKQFSMIESRLKSRLIKLSLGSFKEYISHLKKNLESESQALISLLTTHHTFFFREFPHFEFMLNHALEELIATARKKPNKTIEIWSAAASKGHEVYSLAMFFDFHLKAVAPDVKYKIYGTDVDPESIAVAKNGVYRNDELKQSPATYLGDHWVRGTDEVKNFSKVKKSLKDNTHFEVCNLFSIKSFVQNRKFDLIFCRNVFIYFNADQIKQLSQSLLDVLEPHGYFILGLSESLNGINNQAQLIAPSTYRIPPKATAENKAPAPYRPIVVEAAKPFRILCIDDSSTIHSLLGQILSKEYGFEVKGNAMNGREAINILKTETFDAITLDLHMPELDGIGFLTEYKNRDIPIIVVSSVNRDDLSMAHKALALGAMDYVEKPSLQNKAQAGNEIRSKLKMTIQSKKLKSKAA